MKVKIGTFTLSGGVTTVRGIESPSNLSIDGQRVVQVAKYLRATAAKPIARGNRTKTIAFTVYREHASTQAAELFALTHDEDVPESGLLTIAAEDGRTQLTRYIPNACVQNVKVTHNGSISISTYTIIGGRFQPSPT